ncbi:hypothetical protein [Mycobacterium seoulense]|uniref:hypothetical protein n=1 Tax=Mycobacterium seoulense TaxID=386911 RepID=UPI0013D6F0D9|nr:hypothetical protein [Mycobacterium seoulense]MCV7436066.1 hypothetical protein [Mycobacterium seoulense]
MAGGNDGGARQTHPDLQALKNAQSRARRVGLFLSKQGTTYTLLRGTGEVIATGNLPSVLAHIPDRRRYAHQSQPRPQWQQIIDDYLLTLAAAGKPNTTITLRRIQLSKMGREIGGTPTELTADEDSVSPMTTFSRPS